MIRQGAFFFFLLYTVYVSAQTDSTTYTDEPKVFTYLEQMPEYPDGDQELMRFIVRNIQYPQWERKKKIEGKVMIRFVITEDGSVQDVNVIKGVSPGLDAEAIRVVKLLKNFVPGRQQGKPVRVYFNIPIPFKL